MFTGITEAQGTIKAAAMHGICFYVKILHPRQWKLHSGESISVDGVCSTVVHTGRAAFDVEYMPETLRVTTAGSFKKNRVVNLERSLRFGERVDGHFVQGHIDGVGVVRQVTKRGSSTCIAVSARLSLQRYIAQKGSIAINGVSLTVSRKVRNGFVVALIPHTLAHTNLCSLKKGDQVNIETDILSRQLAAILGKV